MMLLRKMAGKVRGAFSARVHRGQKAPVVVAVATPRSLAELVPPGYRLITASGLHQAADLLAKHEIAAIFYDRDSPNNDWHAAVPMLAGARSRPCVVLISHSHSSELWEQVTASGGYDVLRKPVHPEEFQRMLRAAVSQWQNCRQLELMRQVHDHR